MDIRTLSLGNGRFDYAIATPGLAEDGGLETAVIVSLFTDARAEVDDVPPDGGGDRRGWWGDAWPATDGDRIGSRLWLLTREKATAAVLRRAEAYAQEALAWLIEDGVAERVDVQADHVRPQERGQAHALGLTITLHRPGEPPARFRFADIWGGQDAV